MLPEPAIGFAQNEPLFAQNGQMWKWGVIDAFEEGEKVKNGLVLL